jgi:hypothetical protein
MPRFRKLTTALQLRTGEGSQQVLWRFARTPPVERAFTAAHAIDDPAARGEALLSAMADALQDWEGVRDEEGRPLPYSPEAFFEYVPASLRAEVLRRWMAAMLGDPEAAQPASGAADTQQPRQYDVGEGRAEDDPDVPGPLPTDDASSEVSADERVEEPGPQLAFALEPASPPAGGAPVTEEPAAAPAPPASDSIDTADQRQAHPPGNQVRPEASAHPAPRPPGPADLPQPSSRVAQATSLRPLSPPPAEQTRPPASDQAIPSPQPIQPQLIEADPPDLRPPDASLASSPCADDVCPLLDPDFDWELLIRPAWEALHKRTRREGTTEAAF